MCISNRARSSGFGGRGFLLDRPQMIEPTLRAARAAHNVGKPVLINTWLGATDFRKSSISI
jgi:hypothetical protein